MTTRQGPDGVSMFMLGILIGMLIGLFAAAVMVALGGPGA